MLALNNVALPVHPSINIWIVLKGDSLDVRFICLLFQVQLLDHALLAEKFVHSRCFGEVTIVEFLRVAFSSSKFISVSSK